MQSATFYELERLNALIDIWIDEEEYEKPVSQFVLTVSEEANEILGGCFREESPDIKLWERALSLGMQELPIEKAILIDGEEIDISADEGRYWSVLFWSKLLRSGIQKKNTDEYLNLLDSLEFYLERNLPPYTLAIQQKRKRLQHIQLMFIFIMEISALGVGYRQLGHAEKAQKMLRFVKRYKFIKCYERWVWFNLGIAYGHVRRFRDSLRNFNILIETLDPMKAPEPELDYYKDDLERRCIYFPALLHRSMIQLKLQLPYHALKTIQIIYNQVKSCSSNKFRYICLKAKLIELEAYQQLDLTQESEQAIQELYNELFNERCDCLNVPDIAKRGSKPALQTRLVEFVIASLFNAAQRDELTDIEKFEKIKELLLLFPSRYWDWVKANELDRHAYFARFAKLIALAAKLSKRAMNAEPNPWPHELITIVDSAYQTLIRNNLFSKADFDQKHISLRSLSGEDLAEFIEGMLDFYDNMIKDNVAGNGHRSEHLRADYRRFLSIIKDYEYNYGERRRIDGVKRIGKFLNINNIRADHLCRRPHLKCFAGSSNRQFKGLLACAGNREHLDEKDQSDALADSNYEKIMADAEHHFFKHLKNTTVHNPKRQALHFLGLQRWNSLTPAQGRSVGGGYFIYRTDKQGRVDLGIAIDPGFDFVRNLFHMGFSLRDLDIILISHAHADHLWDFESIIQLLNYLSKKKRKLIRVQVILTLGIYRKIQHIINNPVLKKHIQPYIIDGDKEIKGNYFENLGSLEHGIRFCFKNNKENNTPERWTSLLPGEDNPKYDTVIVSPTRAYHDDYSVYSDSFGFIMEFNQPVDNEPPVEPTSFKIGYTGDTKWIDNKLYPKQVHVYKGTIDKDFDIASQYKDCDVLLLHLGSLISHREKATFSNYKANECDSLIRNENHPYLMGTLRFIKYLNNRKRLTNPDNPDYLLLIGEFGEELRGGIRIDLVRRLWKRDDKAKPILPVDVGLDVLLTEYSSNRAVPQNPDLMPAERYRFWCSICKKFEQLTDIDYERFGHDEAIFYVCRTCKKATPRDVIEARLRHLYEVGRALNVASYE